MEIKEFLQRIDKVKECSNDQYTGCCPAHDDKNASLSISVGRDNKILLKCQAGCDTESIVSAMGLTMKDLFSTPKPAPKKRTKIAEYVYTDIDGTIVHKKIRYSDKSFTQAHLEDGKWVYNLKGITPLLYNLPEVTQGIKDNKTIYIVEGEKDADNLKKCNKIATTNTHGAGTGKWLSHYNDHLINSTIVIISDNDAVGKQFSIQIANNLFKKASSVKLVDLTKIFPELPEHGDISDLIEKFGNTVAMDMLDKYVEGLAEYEPKAEDETQPEELDALKQMFRNTGYDVQHGQTIQTIYKADGSTDIKTLANFVAWCEGETTTDDGAETIKTFTIKGRHASGKPLPQISVGASEFSNMNWVTKSWGFNCNINAGGTTKDKLRHCIQQVSKDIRQDTIYLHTGWRKHRDKWIYLHAGGSVGADDINVKLDGKLSHYRQAKILPQEKNGVIKESLKLLEVAPHKITLPLMAFAFLSPLNEFLKQAGYEPKFLYFLMGKTGCGKSTIAALFMSYFGRFNNTSLPCSFMDTANAVISLSFLAKDNLITIDDYKPSNKGDVNRMDNTAQTALRAFGERTGRNRLNSNSTLMTQRVPRGNAIITGETQPNVGESGIARLIVSEIHKGNINFAEVTKAQRNASNEIYSKAMTAYIEWLKKEYIDTKMGEFMALLPTQFEHYRNEIGASLKDTVHPRVVEAFAHISMGLEFFTDFCLEHEAITTNEADKLRGELKTILKEMAEEHAELSRDDKPSIKFVTVLRELINTNAVHISSETGYNSKEEEGRVPFIGYQDEENYYLFAEATYKCVYDFCNKQGSYFPVGSKTLIKHLADEGLIKVENGERTPRRTIRGKRSRFLIMPMEVIEE